MHKTTLTLLFLAFTAICCGQTSQIKYFESEWLEKELPESKAKFSQTITQNTDGTTTTEVKNIKKSEIVRSETFKGNEPYGIWKFQYGSGFKTIDYNFPLIYSVEKCNDSVSFAVSDYFKNNDSIGYTAPKISIGELNLNIYQYLVKNTFYPASARENGIQGTVYLQLTLTATGAENIIVQRGVDISLDKEAVRVLRELKFSSPPSLNGQTYIFKCLVIPIIFKLM
jgi:TonB family protein